MEGIRAIGLSICAVTVITALFSMLSPQKKLDNVLRFSITLFFLVGLISPFLNQKLDFYVPLDGLEAMPQASISQSVEDSVMNIAKSKLENELENTLTKKDIKDPEVTIILGINHNNKENSISIKQLMVLIDEADVNKSKIISSVLKDQVGTTPQILMKNK